MKETPGKLWFAFLFWGVLLLGMGMVPESGSLALLPKSAYAKEVKPAPKAPAEKPRLIVLPFTPQTAGNGSGIGLAAHFFLGNITALHPDLEEFWFSWRMPKLFPTKKALQDYCLGQGPPLDMVRLSREQKIRFWLSGRVEAGKEKIKVSLTLTDTEASAKVKTASFFLDTADNLKSFCRAFLTFLGDGGLGLPAASLPLACWPEKTTKEGLNALGQALMTYYLHTYEASNTPLDLASFRQALAVAPESYLARDLLGWALYKNDDFKAAQEAFGSALQANPHGLGAMGGLMWCAVGLGQDQEAYKWGKAQAGLRGEDPCLEMASVANRLGNAALKAGDLPAAKAYFRKAMALNPAKVLYVTKLAEVLAKLGQDDQALAVLDQALARFTEKAEQKALAKARAEIIKKRPPKQ